MADYLSWLEEHLTHIYDQNPFVRLLEISVVTLREGSVELSMPVVDKHMNLYNNVHGGALASLADTAMGVACASLGKRVVTMEMNINFIKGTGTENMLKGLGKILHDGRNTMVSEAEIIDQNGELLAKARGTFYVIGQFVAE